MPKPTVSLLPLVPAVVVAGIEAWHLATYLAVHGTLPLALWVVSLSSMATVIGLAALSSGICIWLTTHRRTLSPGPFVIGGAAGFGGGKGVGLLLSAVILGLDPRTRGGGGLVARNGPTLEGHTSYRTADRLTLGSSPRVTEEDGVSSTTP